MSFSSASAVLHFAAMDSRTIKHAHARRIADEIGRSLGYLSRLSARMDAVGFPPDDKLRMLVARAHEAMHALRVEAHYLGCQNGVGRRERDASP